MAELKIGQIIGIPCNVFPGAFPHEAMVIVETMAGDVSGFVKRDELTRVEDNQGYIRGRIVDITEDAVSVVLKGSFFTTTGLTHFSPEWTESNMEVVAA